MVCALAHFYYPLVILFNPMGFREAYISRIFKQKMTSPSQEVNEEQHQHNLYAAYGKFCIQFEQVVEEIREVILTFFNVKDRKKILVLISDQTAAPLLQKCISLIHQEYSSWPKAIKQIDALSKETISLIERRNEIVHGYWSGGFVKTITDTPRDTDIAYGAKLKLKKSGAELLAMEFKVEHFEYLSNKLRLAGRIFASLCALLNHQYIGEADRHSNHHFY